MEHYYTDICLTIELAAATYHGVRQTRGNGNGGLPARRLDRAPLIGLFTGTGLGESIASIPISAAYSFGDLPHFPVSTVESHPGRLLFGTHRRTAGDDHAGPFSPLRGLLAACGRLPRPGDAATRRRIPDSDQRRRRSESALSARRSHGHQRPHQPDGRQSARRAQRGKLGRAVSRHDPCLRPAPAAAGRRRRAARRRSVFRPVFTPA